MVALPSPLPLAQAAASLVAPGLAVAGLVAVAVPITLHLLSRRRRKQRPWAAMRFLREAIEKQRRRLRFERWLLLAVRCLALALLGLALAGPLVGGRLASALGVAGATGRTVDLLVDNGIAAGATDATGAGGPTPLEEAKRRGAALLATLGPEDRVRVWPLAGVRTPEPRAAGPEAGARREDPTPVPPAEAAAALEALAGTDAGPAWEQTLPRVAEAARADRRAGAEAAVVVLSPLFAGDGRLATGRGPGAGSDETGDGPRVLLSRPASGRTNLQVASVRPARAVVAIGAAGPAAAALEALVTVRRAGSAAGAGAGAVDARVEVRVLQQLDSLGSWTFPMLAEAWPAVGSGSAVVTLPAGVEEATARVRVAVDGRVARRGPCLLLAKLAGAGAGAGGGAGGGAVAADDTAAAGLELVDRVRVGVAGGETGAGTGTLGAADFFVAALGGDPATPPGLATPGPEPPFLVTETEAAAVEPRPVAGVSGVAGAAGGRFHANPPPPRSGSEAAEAVLVLDPAGLDAAGRAALAAFAASGGALWVTPSADAPPDQPGAGLGPLFEALGLPWRPSPPPATGAPGTPGPRRAEADAPPPPALPLLAGQWEALLRPLRFERAVGLDGLDPADAWARLQGGTPFLASSRAAGPAGAPGAGGAVVWLAAAADPAWTNLPAKPLFPALVRDGLLAAVSARAEGGGPHASPRVDQETASVSNLGGFTVTNPDAAAADTSAVAGPRALAFFSGLGEVAFLDADPAAGVFPADAARASLAGAFLWVVLALLVLEALAGRAFTRG